MSAGTGGGAVAGRAGTGRPVRRDRRGGRRPDRAAGRHRCPAGTGGPRGYGGAGRPGCDHCTVFEGWGGAAVTATGAEARAAGQRGRAAGAGIVVQGGRDAYYVAGSGLDRAMVAPLRPAVGRTELEPAIRGRDELLAGLDAVLSGTASGPRVRVLHGMGGCGKTTVARELARRALGRQIPVWWVAAAVPESVTGGMQALAV